MPVQTILFTILHKQKPFAVMFLLMLLMLFMAGLSGCGKTGGLYLPDEKSAGGQTKVSNARENYALVFSNHLPFNV